MKNHLKFVIGSFALLACLAAGPAARAEASAPAASAQPYSVAKQAVIGPLAWQRVGSPLSLNA